MADGAAYDDGCTVTVIFSVDVSVTVMPGPHWACARARPAKGNMFMKDFILPLGVVVE